ncbi:MAG: pantoate--beta-alanine ligase [Methylococcales bacterium]|nr:pantoate--beta-alanine ligase [Methylococcales bacterium]MDP3837916.1 pantoate--beta-alanine ligase [Methylococcales bacterium]
MQIVNTVQALRTLIHTWKAAGKRVAFVPTMGNLHAGHCQLVTAAQQHADKVVVSIFVNPTQFGVGEDFDSYPRTEAQDQEKLQAIGADLLFLPSVEEMYSPTAKTVVSVAGLSELYCGASRVGHFDGVATVVCKLFNMVQPDVALFGLKDFQQLTVIRTMVNDLNMPVDIIGIDTVREASGLAMSSRNGYLTPEQRQTAPLLYQSLCAAREAMVAGLDYMSVEKNALSTLQNAGFQPDYFHICRSVDLAPAQQGDTELVLLVAAKLGKTRLIDNLYFTR